MARNLAFHARENNGYGMRYENPAVPFNIKLPRIQCGGKICIYGAVTAEPDRFSINLRNSENDTNTYLHFNPRFSGDNCVVRNSKCDDAWGSEERDGDNPFAAGQLFYMEIELMPEGYMVSVNGSNFTTFAYREGMPLCDVTHMAVDGDVICHAIDIPLNSLPIPFVVGIPQRLSIGDWFTISGDIDGKATTCAINLQSSENEESDIAFHFNPRLGDGVIVCNSRKSGSWDDEIRESTFYAPGQTFWIYIAVTKECYEAYTNGTLLLKLPHRLSPNSAAILHIMGDLSLTDVIMRSLPKLLAPQMGDSKVRITDNAVQLLQPKESAVLELDKPLEVGDVIFLHYLVDTEPSRFFINLQCGGSDDANIALHINPRWDDDSGKVLVLNHCEGGSWGEEIRESHPILLSSADLFSVQMTILCKENGYVISVSGDANVTFAHRINCGAVTHIVADGCITVRQIAKY